MWCVYEKSFDPAERARFRRIWLQYCHIGKWNLNEPLGCRRFKASRIRKYGKQNWGHDIAAENSKSFVEKCMLCRNHNAHCAVRWWTKLKIPKVMINERNRWATCSTMFFIRTWCLWHGWTGGNVLSWLHVVSMTSFCYIVTQIRSSPGSGLFVS